MSSHDRQTTIVCDPDYNLVPSIRSRYMARIEEFNEKRVLSTCGSADELLPQVLTTLTSLPETIGNNNTRKKSRGNKEVLEQVV